MKRKSLRRHVGATGGILVELAAPLSAAGPLLPALNAWRAEALSGTPCRWSLRLSRRPGDPLSERLLLWQGHPTHSTLIAIASMLGHKEATLWLRLESATIEGSGLLSWSVQALPPITGDLNTIESENDT